MREIDPYDDGAAMIGHSQRWPLKITTERDDLQRQVADLTAKLEAKTIALHCYEQSLTDTARERDDLTRRLEEAQADKRKWALALQELTPGGSEYVDDPKRCVTYVRDTRSSLLDVMKGFKRERDALQAKLADEQFAYKKLSEQWNKTDLDNSQLRTDLAQARAQIEKAVKAWRAQVGPQESMRFRAVMRELEAQHAPGAAGAG